MVVKLLLFAVVSLSVIGARPSLGDAWQVVSLNGRSVTGEPEIIFASDGSISGSTGCNRFQANGTMEAGALIIEGPVAVTKMACPGDVPATQDDAIVALLQDRIDLSYDPFSGELTLGKAGPTLVLSAAPMESRLADMPEPHAGLDAPSGEPPYLGVFGLSDGLAILSEPSEVATVLAQVPSGTILRNSGCSQAAGGKWCEVTSISGAVTGWARADNLEPANDSLRAGQNVFDATGQIPCAKGAGAPMTQCSFGVGRDGGGTATVVIFKPDGVERALFFENGAFVSADTSEAGGGFETSVTREADLNLIRVDDERYEIPDTVVFGG